jgi:hypothetical protein
MYSVSTKNYREVEKVKEVKGNSKNLRLLLPQQFPPLG